MSAIGTKRTWTSAMHMSASGGKADIDQVLTNLDLWVNDPPQGGTKIICTNENRQRRAGLLLLNVQIFKLGRPVL